MRQVVMTEPGKIEMRDVPAPEAGPGQVLLRINRIGVCGSDIHVYHGKHPMTGYPVVQGLGEGTNGVKVGDLVTARPQVVCGECRPCRRGDYHICDTLYVEGFQRPGVAQDLFAVPKDRIVPLPEGFTPEQGAMVEPVACGVHAVTRAREVEGRNVAVVGAGPIGNLIGQVARSRGANVLISDISDLRLDIARKCGLEKTFNPRKESMADAARRAFGDEGFSVALEAVGVEETMNDLIENIEKGGTIVVVGVFPDRPRINMQLVQDHELTMYGTMMYKHEDYRKAVELIHSGKVRTEPLVTGHFPLEKYHDAYRLIEEKKDACMKIMIDL